MHALTEFINTLTVYLHLIHSVAILLLAGAVFGLYFRGR